MEPLNGGKVKGRVYNEDIHENVLDNMVGSGSERIKKAEQSPLFKPETNMNYIYGAPNQSDFMQSRVNNSMKNNNVKPFESVSVAPMDYDRSMFMPKTIDELRVETNPKMEYTLEGHQGAANSVIKNSSTTQSLGRVEKQRPDTFYINTQDRLLTTTGIEKGERQRPTQEIKDVKRLNAETNYSGPSGGDKYSSYLPGKYEQTKRLNSKTYDTTIMSASGKGPNEKTTEIKSYTNYSNNRTTVKHSESTGIIGGTIGAVIAPLMDILNPTRKEETINNARIYGNMKSASNQYVLDTHNKAPQTIKETTLYTPNLSVTNQKNNTYTDNNIKLHETQRETTSGNFIGPSGGAASKHGNMNYDAAYKQHNNEIKSSTINNRPNHGGTQIFNQQVNLSNVKKDDNIFNGRVNAPNMPSNLTSASVDIYGKLNNKNDNKYHQSNNMDNNAELLKAFKSNPYTHSLTDIA